MERMEEKDRLVSRPPGNDFLARMEQTIHKARQTQGSFFVLILCIQNMAEYRRKRPPHVVNGLLRELYQAVRTAVHPSQYVGMFHDGLGLVFDGVSCGHADLISRRLLTITQQIIRSGHYNDLTSRWTDVLYQFLWPNSPGLLLSRAGWAIYPRDGSSPIELLRRAQNHATELSR